jgi:secretion/DNA translocation related TadE-like protein
MPGSALAVGIVSATAASLLALAAVAAAGVHAQRAAAAADGAALAAADAASGAITGFPCERAREVAEAMQVSLHDCEVTGLIATVTIGATFGHLPVEARARAGPPP